MAWRTACQPLNWGRRLGCVLRTRPGYAAWNSPVMIVPKPAIATRSMSLVANSLASATEYPVRSNWGEKPPKSARSTSNASIPLLRATSSPRHGRSDATSATSSPPSIIASRIVPDPDTSTQRRTCSKVLERLDDLDHLLSRFSRVQADVHAGPGERVHLRLRRTLRARNDGTRVTHLSSRRSRHARDVRDDWFGHVVLDPLGGSEAERAAEWIKHTMTKPAVSYIAGVTAPAGRKMGHAGAIISGSKGTAQAKMDALAGAGVHVCLNPTEAGQRMVEIVRAL